MRQDEAAILINSQEQREFLLFCFDKLSKSYRYQTEPPLLTSLIKLTSRQVWGLRDVKCPKHSTHPLTRIYRHYLFPPKKTDTDANPQSTENTKLQPISALSLPKHQLLSKLTLPTACFIGVGKAGKVGLVTPAL